MVFLNVIYRRFTERNIRVKHQSKSYQVFYKPHPGLGTRDTMVNWWVTVLFLLGTGKTGGGGVHLLREPLPTFGKRMFPPSEENLRGKHQLGDRSKS